MTNPMQHAVPSTHPQQHTLAMPRTPRLALLIAGAMLAAATTACTRPTTTGPTAEAAPKATTTAGVEAATTSPAAEVTPKAPASPTVVDPLLTDDALDNTNAEPHPYAVPVLPEDSPVNLVWHTFPAVFADFYCTKGFGPPVVPSPIPAFCKSPRPLLMRRPGGPLTSAMLFDQSKGSGVYDTLYVDFNDNGNFRDDPVYKAEPYDHIGGPDTGEVASWFPNVHVRRSGKNRSAHVQIFLEFVASYARSGSAPFNVCAIAQRWAVGQAMLAGRPAAVALIDRTWNDSVTDAAGRDPALGEDRITRGDYLIIDERDATHLLPNQREQPYRRGTPRVFLNHYLQTDTGTFEVKTQSSAAGVKLDLLPTKLPMGTMRTPEHEPGMLILIGKKVSAILTASAAASDSPDGQLCRPAVIRQPQTRRHDPDPNRRTRRRKTLTRRSQAPIPISSPRLPVPAKPCRAGDQPHNDAS